MIRSTYSPADSMTPRELLADNERLQAELAAVREERDHAMRQSALAIADKVELRNALRPVVREAKAKGFDYEHPSWNPDAHIELTLTIREMRAIAARAGRGEGDSPQPVEYEHKHVYEVTSPNDLDK